MRFDYKEEFHNSRRRSNATIVLASVGAMGVLTLVVGIVLVLNTPNQAKKESVVRVEEPENPAQNNDPMPEGEYMGSGLTSDDLDFWDMYADDEKEEEKERETDDMPKEEITSVSRDETEMSYDGEGRSIEGAAGNGETFNAADSGEPEEVSVDETIPKNGYIADSFRQEGSELQYYASNRKISSYGVNVSKYQGRVDWEKVAASGVDFAMIRMGVRGYSTGSVVYDEEFENNIKGATEHGLDVGIYFYSQATGVQEAVEEANYAVAAAAAYNVTYPIVFYTEKVEGESYRTEYLTPQELTDIALAFCDTVKGYGRRAMVGASKHRLSVDMEPSRLSDTDVWLLDSPHVKEGERLLMSEYPYRYTMWQYSTDGQIDGIEGNADLNISFVDYKYR